MSKAKTKEKAFSKNILSDDEVMEQGYYSAPSKVENEAVKEVEERLGLPVNITRKPENQKTRKSKKPAQTKATTKPRSFGDEPVEKIAVEIPKRLVKQMKMVVLNKDSRFNLETAAAFEMYIKNSSRGG